MSSSSALDTNAQIRLDIRQLWQTSNSYLLDPSPSDEALRLVQESVSLLLAYDDKFLTEMPVLGEGRVRVLKSDVKFLEDWAADLGAKLRTEYRELLRGDSRARTEALSKPIVAAKQGAVVVAGAGGDFAAQVADVVRRHFPELAPSLGLQPEDQKVSTQLRNESKVRAVASRPKPPARGWRVFKTRALVQLRGENNLVRTAAEQLNATPVIDGWLSIRALAVAIDTAAPKNLEPLLKLLNSKRDEQLIVVGPPLIDRTLEYRLLLPPQKISVRAWTLPEVKK